jgi:hypothetical protein
VKPMLQLIEKKAPGTSSIIYYKYYDDGSWI